MTGDKITYGESIECPGRWRRMDYETTVKEGETDTEAGNRAQLFVQNFLSQNNPQLYQEQTPYPEVPITPEHKNTPEQAAQELIETATPSNIKWFKHLPEKYPQLKELYQQKLKELTK